MGDGSAAATSALRPTEIFSARPRNSGALAADPQPMQLALILVFFTEPAEAAEAAVPSTLAQPDDPLPLIHGGSTAPLAWLALWRGDAWVCWDAPSPGCWQRLELAGLVDLPNLRAEFIDPSTLVLGDEGEPTWWIVRGDPGPRLASWTTTPRQTPHPRTCAPLGALPVATRERLGFLTLPCPEAAHQPLLCVRPARALRLRRPAMLRLRLGLELRTRERGRSHVPRGDTLTTGLQLLAVVQFGIDPARFVAQRRERATLQARARPSLRALPAARSRGPLRAAEHEALRAAVCERAR